MERAPPSNMANPLQLKSTSKRISDSVAKSKTNKKTKIKLPELSSDSDDIETYSYKIENYKTISNDDSSENDGCLGFDTKISFRSGSPTLSDCSDSYNVDKLEEDLKRIAADQTVCDVTMTKVLTVLHDHFPWLPDNVSALRNEPVKKTEFQQILERLNDIKKEQMTMLKELYHLKDTKFNARYAVDTEEKVSFQLPFNELEKFQKFDEQLKHDRESSMELKSIFMKETGSNIKIFIKKNLKILFTQQLAKNFTYKGRQGNIRCKNFQSIILLKDCVLEKFPDTTDSTFDTLATKYFYYIKDIIQKVKKKDETMKSINQIQF